MVEIRIMKTDLDILGTFPLMKQLRTGLSKDIYCDTIRGLQTKYCYNLVAVSERDHVRSVAGYRITESLAWSRYLYVDDLITEPHSRAKGYARLLFDWLESEAITNNCNGVHLDSGVHRFDAHRLYLNQKLFISCHHFQKDFNTSP
ncbi:GNAT superfamily N-acetyltransferase [Paenibacillus sp. DS2015]|uniref:GNAT family N-acetyltransferase n=1 Tax=Paenibacillus sp. DS2015 TaxID=3373917 RepID=UPI003D19B256